jgi:hypothetical protein
MLGKRIDLKNEAHVLTATSKGLVHMRSQCAALDTVAARRAVIARAYPLLVEQGKAMAAAIRGDFRWRQRLEAQGRTIHEFWDGEQILWPGRDLIDPDNTASVRSFVIYLANSVAEFMIHPVLVKAMDDAEAAALADPFVIVDSLDDVVE